MGPARKISHLTNWCGAELDVHSMIVLLLHSELYSSFSYELLNRLILYRQFLPVPLSSLSLSSLSPPELYNGVINCIFRISIKVRASCYAFSMECVFGMRFWNAFFASSFGWIIWFWNCIFSNENVQNGERESKCLPLECCSIVRMIPVNTEKRFRDVSALKWSWSRETNRFSITNSANSDIERKYPFFASVRLLAGGKMSGAIMKTIFTPTSATLNWFNFTNNDTIRV